MKRRGPRRYRVPIPTRAAAGELVGRDPDGFAQGSPRRLCSSSPEPSCLSRAGVARIEHAFDSDGVCIYCDLEVEP